MLHHGQPAVVCCLGKLGALVADIGKTHLLILFGIGEHCRAGEGMHHHVAAGRIDIITLNLEIGVRRDRLIRTIDDFPGHIHNIAAALEGKDTGNAYTLRAIRFQSHLQFVLTFGQFERAIDTLEQTAMRGQAITDQTALCLVVMLRAKKMEILFVILALLVIQELQPDQITTLGGDRDLGQIGGHGTGFCRSGRLFFNQRCARLSRCLQIDRRLWRIAVASALLRRCGCCWRDRPRIFVLLPVVPQHVAGEGKNHDQNQASSVHGPML